MSDAVYDDIFTQGDDDDEGFSAADRIPLSLVGLLNNAAEPMETRNDTKQSKDSPRHVGTAF